MAVPRTFGETALALHAQGWRPIPLHPETKVPAEGGWHLRNAQPWDDRELRLAVIHHRDDACGLAIPASHMALDLDVTDASAARRLGELADEHIGVTPLVRTGRPPKTVRLYRAGGTVVSTKPHPIEVYSGTGQVAVFGWHAKAGKPYTWDAATPLDLAADDPAIPLVSDADVRAFLTAADKVVATLRRARRATGGSGVGKDAGAELGQLLRAGVSFDRAARMILEGAVDGGRHYAVRAVVSYGYNYGVDADRIARVIERAAPPALLEHVGDYVGRCLADFAPEGRAW